MTIKEQEDKVRSIYNRLGLCELYEIELEALHDMRMSDFANLFRFEHNLGDKEKTPFCE